MSVLTRISILLIALFIGLGESCGALVLIPKLEVPSEEVSQEDHQIFTVSINRKKANRKKSSYHFFQTPAHPTGVTTSDFDSPEKCLTDRYLLFRALII